MVQVQLRLEEGTVDGIDKLVAEGRFKSRSDAIRSMVKLYEEREKTRKFYRMLAERSREAREKPETLIKLEEVE